MVWNWEMPPLPTAKYESPKPREDMVCLMEREGGE
jgi:hypothetical protein